MAEIATGIATGVVSGIVSATGVDIIRGAINKFDEVRDYEKNLDNTYEKLEEELKKLCARKDDVWTKINMDKTKQATKECDVWIAKVNKLEKDVKSLEARYREEKNNFGLHLDLSKSLEEKYNEVHGCWAEGSIFATEVLMIERPPEPVIKMKAPKIDDKPSLQGIIEEILKFLRDKYIKRIGLWGMVGVGKTAIMQNLNNNAQIAETFQIVIFVTITEEGNEEKSQLAREKLQREIAQRLKLNIKGITDIETIALKISMELASKRYLLLLDDVWGELNLEDIGIRDNENDSKIVLATRHRDICHDMDVDEIINVKPLSNVDARKLFIEKVGRNLNHSDFDRVAQLVIRECASLPLVIDRVARAFRKKDRVCLWKAGLGKLRRWPNVNFQGMDEVLDRLRFCYDELDEEDNKICFLYSALYTNGREIYRNYMLECWIAQGFIRDVEDFTARGQEILDNLINVSLLEDGENSKHVRMNKVLRNMALKISSESEESKTLVRTGEELREPPGEEEWRDAKWISLMDNNLCTLPESPDCRKLSTLFLQRNYDLEVIPELFFQSMGGLEVLDLHGTKISALPSSLSCLTSLKALFFNSCNKLMELPSEIGALRHLEVLDIRGTGINFLSIQIESWSRLRCLRISLPNVNGESMDVDCSQHVISKLKMLEELVIDVHPENQSWCGAMRCIAAEVAKLSRLTSVSLYFPDVEILQYFIMHSPTWKDMDPCFTFQFSIGLDHPAGYSFFDYEYDVCRCLKYANGEGMHLAVLEVLAETNAFELIGHKGAVSLSEFGIDTINKIRSCLIESCTQIETIIDNNGITKGVFECLEKMFISNAPKLESIWEGSVPSGSLSQLTTLVFFRCAKLKKIFSTGMIPQLFKLQHLEVKECEEIEEIVMESEINGPEPGELPSLTTLILHDLPQLRRVWSDNLLKCPSPKEFKISGCPLLENFPSFCYNTAQS